VQRPGRAQRRRGVWGSPPTTTQHSTSTRRRKPSAAARPSAAGIEGSGVSPDYNTTQHANSKKKAKRSGQAERSGVGGFGGLPRLRQSNSHKRRRRRSRAPRPGRAQRRREVRGPPPTTVIQHTTRTHAEEGQAECSGKGRLGVFPDCGSATRPCAKEAKLSDNAERSWKRAPLGFKSNQRAAKARTNAERSAACKTKRR
jgi:hypothetical protein